MGELRDFLAALVDMPFGDRTELARLFGQVAHPPRVDPHQPRAGRVHGGEVRAHHQYS